MGVTTDSRSLQIFTARFFEINFEIEVEAEFDRNGGFLSEFSQIRGYTLKLIASPSVRQLDVARRTINRISACNIAANESIIFYPALNTTALDRENTIGARVTRCQ